MSKIYKITGIICIHIGTYRHERVSQREREREVGNGVGAGSEAVKTVNGIESVNLLVFFLLL